MCFGIRLDTHDFATIVRDLCQYARGRAVPAAEFQYRMMRCHQRTRERPHDSMPQGLAPLNVRQAPCRIGHHVPHEKVAAARKPSSLCGGARAEPVKKGAGAS